MPWIKTVEPEEATGELKSEYEKAVCRAGKVFNILKLQSLKPQTLKASMELYLATMYTASGLSRAEREMLATVVSWANQCFYWIEAHGEDLRRESRNPEFAQRVKRNYEFAQLSPREKALCKFAELLTRAPAAIRSQDVETLRIHGLSDSDVLDAVEVISYFNYINRVADGLGIDPEPEMRQAWEGRQYRGGQDP
jgi:uncharacterized peroxidase-related enzyme